ncbi:MAG: hypothetical protein Ta2B_17850 [Termitinemataceae bacterium]|nr:MAG: hypothetical protein Ta2B_17850 [Termitinemataceae bacterium]
MVNLTNIYWPVYKNLESELIKLSYNIQIDDTQLSVYSAQIADLILRGAIEIESIAKELCRQENTHINIHKFDFDCLDGLNKKWSLDKKIVIISGSTCYQTQRILIPFVLNETNIKSRPICSWNNAYQNLKHDKITSLNKFGTIKYLFYTMAALFTLNIYYKNETIQLGHDYNAVHFPDNLGSDLFSIKVNKGQRRDDEHDFSADFDECIYWTHWTQKTYERISKMNDESNRKINEAWINLISHDVSCLTWTKDHPGEEITTNILQKILGDSHSQHLRSFIQKFGFSFNDVRNADHEAVLNKGKVLHARSSGIT